MYYGEYTVILDEKGRITVPRRTRETMEVLGHFVWYLTRGFDGAVFLFHQEEWKKIREFVSRFPSIDTKVLDFRRLFFGSVAEARLDMQGRLSIAPHLREHAQIEKEAVLIGVEDHLELWSKDAWKAFVDKKETEYKQMAMPLFSLNWGEDKAKPQEGLNTL